MRLAFKLAVVLLFVIALHPQANAETVTGTSFGSFKISVPGTNDCVGCQVQSVNGGTNNKVYTSGSNPSSLTANNTSFSVSTNANDVVIGSLKWVNNETTSTHQNPADTNFDIKYIFSLSFTSPNALSDTQAFIINIQQTPNPEGDLVFNLLNSTLNGLGPFVFSNSVTLSDLHFGLAPNSAGHYYTTSQNGHLAGEWTNPENSTSILKIYADFSTAASASPPAVPESSTWAMMILGFLGVGFLAYRRKSPVVSLRVV